MKKLVFLLLITALTIAITGCGTTSNNNNARNNAVNATPINVAPPANTNTNRWNTKISKEEYEKDRARYEAGKDKDTWGNTVEESWLWFKVRSALMMADDLRESTISVNVAKDVVTLTGTVRDEAQKKRAAEVAKVDGVTSVKNELKVAPKDSVTNSTSLSTTDSEKKPAPTKK